MIFTGLLVGRGFGSSLNQQAGFVPVAKPIRRHRSTTSWGRALALSVALPPAGHER